MKDYEQIFIECADETMCSDEFREALQRHIRKCIDDAVRDSFNFGDLRNAVRGKVNEILVPYIERYDMAAYTAKLDVLLSEIAEQTAVADNRRILENFGALMIDPGDGAASFGELFAAYKKFVKAAASGDGLEVEDGSYYAVPVSCKIVERGKRGFWSAMERVTVDFEAEVDDEAERERLCCSVEFYRFDSTPDGGYRLDYLRKPTIEGLVRMSDFELFLSRIDRAHLLVTDIRAMEDDVFIDAEPTYELV